MRNTLIYSPKYPLPLVIKIINFFKLNKNNFVMKNNLINCFRIYISLSTVSVSCLISLDKKSHQIHIGHPFVEIFFGLSA